MDFVVDKGSQNLVDLLVHNLNYSGPLELTQYFIKKKVFLDRTDEEGMEILYVDIYLGRRLLSIILTVFAPTVILNIVGHSSNYFKEFFFEAVISVNVTAMLVLTTMFINVSNNLPKTAYIKMIDIWLLFNLIKPFNDILVTTYMDYLKVDDEREINHHGVPRAVGADETGDSGGRSDGVLQVVPVSSSRSPSALKRNELVNVNERKQKEALQMFYERDTLKQRNQKRISSLKKFSHVINPLICIS